MVDGFENLNFPQRSDGHAFLLIVHENALKRYIVTIRTVNRLVNFTMVQRVSDYQYSRPNVSFPRLLVSIHNRSQVRTQRSPLLVL